MAQSKPRKWMLDVKKKRKRKRKRKKGLKYERQSGRLIQVLAQRWPSDQDESRLVKHQDQKDVEQSVFPHFPSDKLTLKRRFEARTAGCFGGT
jgi:hypothetical protein